MNDEIGSSNHLACLILAAGYGSRLKSLGSKPLLLYKNKPFVQNITEKAVAAGFAPVLCITNSSFEQEIQALELPIKILLNPVPEKGMFSSIILGLRELQGKVKGALISPVDFPLVKTTTYCQLFSAFKKNSDMIIQPEFDGKMGHPLILPENLFDLITKSGDEITLRVILKKFRHLTLAVKVNDAGIHRNINTPEAYFKFCKENH